MYNESLLPLLSDAYLPPLKITLLWRGKRKKSFPGFNQKGRGKCVANS